MVWPAIIAAGAALGGAMLGGAQERKATHAQEDIAQENRDLQKQFAQQGIRWRVEDAKAAGIHPLAALGAQTSSYQPVSVFPSTGNALGEGITRMGQNISEAWLRQASQDERAMAAHKLEQERLKAEQLDLQNQGLRRELNTMNTTPSMPSGTYQPTSDNPLGIIGQGDTSYATRGAVSKGYVFKENEIPFSQSVGTSAGTVPATDQYIYPYLDAPIAQMPNEQLAESIESGSFVDRAKHGYIQSEGFLSNAKRFIWDKGERSAEWRQMLREHRPAVEPGYIALWDPWVQVWRRVKSYEGDTRLFYDVNPSKQRYGVSN